MDWRKIGRDILILITIQASIFGYTKLIKEYNLGIILLFFGGFCFLFLAKTFPKKIIYSLIYFFTIPVVLIYVPEYLENVFQLDYFNLETFIFQIGFALVIIILGILPPIALNLLTEKVSKRINKKTRRKFIKFFWMIFILAVIIYAAIAKKSVDCYTPDAGVLYYSYKYCTCEGTSLPWIFTYGACLGTCNSCTCGFEGKHHYEKNCTFEEQPPYFDFPEDQII